MRFLIAGLGSIGRRHLRNLIALGQRDIVLYRTGKSTLPSEELAGFPTETDLQAALERRPDAVVVCNPTAFHLEVAIPAAEAGCHLLLEKPVSDSMDRVEELQRAAARGQGRILVGFQFRFHATLQRARAMAREGSLGRVISARASWGEYLPEWHPWEDYRTSYAARRELGGGALLTLCHPLDYLGWILGDVESVQGMVGKALGLEVEAVAEAALRFRSGALGHVHLDYVQRPPEHTLELIGEEGTLHWDGRTGDLKVSTAPEWGWIHQSPPAGYERNEMFMAEMAQFVQVVRGEEAPACSLEDGIRVQKMIETIRRSAREGESSRVGG